MPSPRLVILDFDGTLFETHESIAHCIALTFQAHSKSVPAIEAILPTIASGAGLDETFRMLSAFDSDDDSKLWVDTYRSIYVAEGLPLITPFPGAKETVRWLKRENIPMVLISNKGIKAVETVLGTHRLSDFPNMVLGDTPGVARKPDPESYVRFVAPKFDGLDPKEVVVVGDTAADILFAKNIGAVSCWARYGYGDKEQCEGLEPDMIIDNMQELQELFSVAK